jgi:hypothetical protein
MKKMNYILGATMILALISCKKDTDLITPEVQIQPSIESFASIDDYFNEKKPQTQTFQLTAENGGSFTTENGSEVTVPANAFITPNGQSVLGSITLKMKEVFSNKNMIFSGVFPVSNSNVLNSGGEFFIEASQNGNVLNVKNGQFINVEIPAQAADPWMDLFFAGGVENPDSINWQPVDSAFSGSGFTFNSVDNTYSCNLDSLGWANIDAFMSGVSYFNCTFQLSGIAGLDNQNTTAFAVFKGENAVWPVGISGWGSISGNTISESHLGSVDLNLLVISVVGGQLYYGLLDVLPVDNQIYQINMIPTTSANLDVIINGLP